MVGNPLDTFTPATQSWFGSAFERPTPVQNAAWTTIATGANALVIAPTGSGKTLAAFLQCIDHLTQVPASQHVRVLYVSPLKALAVDVERNLQRPLNGILAQANRMGQVLRPIQVGLRSGDTPPNARRRLVTHPPDILITTPESLFLMLSSQASATLSELELVIVDEIHALAGTKRGAHLALSLERLSALNHTHHLQRVGLSATVRPPEPVAAFLGGAEPVEIVANQAPKRWNLEVAAPLPDMTQLTSVDPVTGAERNSIWPSVEARVLSAVLAHRSVICFVNSRMVAERLTAHLNEQYAIQLGAELPPLGVETQFAYTHDLTRDISGDYPLIARAHHGSISKEVRAEIEADLKAGQLRCVVATNSLELGIDMGAVDLVIQVAAPASVANGLQRIGRAGHQVDAISEGLVLPVARSDLVQAAVVSERMLNGAIEAIQPVGPALDVLAQTVVSMCLDTQPTATKVFELVRRAHNYRNLDRETFDGVLRMLSGVYPSDDFLELVPRIVWDQTTDRINARPGARRVVSISGGTIPDRGAFGVFLNADDADAGRAMTSRRVGELDEEMVHESRVGDVITLGSSTWRIAAITPNQVNVYPATGEAGRLPFWHGDANSRPIELGTALGDFLRDIDTSERTASLTRLHNIGLDAWACDNLLAYITDQKQATGVLPSSAQIVVERFRDEVGDWMVCVHCPLGLSVLRPWAMAVSHRVREKYGIAGRVSVTNDGFVVRFPDVLTVPPSNELLLFDDSELDSVISEELFGSALFAARFRECAARALLLPRTHPGKRSPLWQQRLKAAQLLQVAVNFSDFPIVIEAMRECLEDVFDLAALHTLLRDIYARRVHLIDVETEFPSPFARSVTFGYTAEFLYDSDAPLQTRPAVSDALSAETLAKLLGQAPAATFDADALAEVNDALQPPITSAEQLWDLIRTNGPLSAPECHERGASEDWLTELQADRRIAATPVAGIERFVVTSDVALLAAALGTPPVPAAQDRLILRQARSRLQVTTAQLSDRFGWPQADVQIRLQHLQDEAQLLSTPWCPEAFSHPAVVRRVKRAQRTRARAAVRPVPPTRYAAFLHDWQLGETGSGSTALRTAIEQLAGYPIPASTLESFVLPARVRDYSPAMLDELLTTSEVVWSGAGALGNSDGLVQLWPADLVLPSQDPLELSEDATALLARLGPGGAWRLADLAETPDAALEAALWELCWSGLVSSDTFAPVRALSTSGQLRRPRTPKPLRRIGRHPVTPQPSAAQMGRWFALQRSTIPVAEARLQVALLELSRHGVLCRNAAEAWFGTFAELYPTLRLLEEQGHIQRGYFVAGLPPAQFAAPGALDRLRTTGRVNPILLAATDPANPYGATLPWPTQDGHRPARKAGAFVVLDDGVLIAYLERGAHSLILFETSQAALAFAQIAAAVDAQLGAITLKRINGTPILQAAQYASSLTAAGFAMVPQGFRRRPQSSAR